MPLKYQVRITGEASADLADIFEYIWRNSPQNASDVVEELVSSVEALDVLPHRYKVHQFNDDPGYIIRSMPVPPFVVYYRIIESPPLVRILTIRHGARRKPRRFPE